MVMIIIWNHTNVRWNILRANLGSIMMMIVMVMVMMTVEETSCSILKVNLSSPITLYSLICQITVKPTPWQFNHKVKIPHSTCPLVLDKFRYNLLQIVAAVSRRTESEAADFDACADNLTYLLLLDSIEKVSQGINVLPGKLKLPSATSNFCEKAVSRRTLYDVQSKRQLILTHALIIVFALLFEKIPQDMFTTI